MDSVRVRAPTCVTLFMIARGLRPPAGALLVLVAGAVAVEAVLLIGSPQALVNTDYPAFIAAGRLLATVPVAIVLHALLAFPSGRLTTRPARTLTAVGYLVTTVVLAPQYLFTPLPAPYDPLFVADRPDVLAVLNPAVTIVVGALVLATAVVLAHRLATGAAGTRLVLVGT